MKYLIPLLVVLYIVWRFTTGRKRVDEAKRQAPPDGPQPPLALPMVACAHCGTHLPQNDALLRHDKWYCCAAHRDQAT
jgi:uncharacterized protein